MRRAYAATIGALLAFDATESVGVSVLVFAAVVAAIGSARKAPES